VPFFLPTGQPIVSLLAVTLNTASFPGSASAAN
jgi:hypothetical protein